MEEYKISIIIPVFNRVDLLQETLISIKRQSYKNWECILVDDGSLYKNIKQIKELVAIDNRFMFFTRPSSLSSGPSSSRNHGFQKSTGQYILWFDSDDILVSNALSSISLHFHKHPDGVVSPIEFFDFENKKYIKINNIYSKRILEDYFLGKISFYVCGILWNREFLTNQNHLFDDQIRNLDDWDFNLRMLYSSPTLIYRERAVAVYRIHSNSLTQELRNLNLKEVKSEFSARLFHYEFLKNKKEVSKECLQNFLINRSKFFLRNSLVYNRGNLVYYLIQVLKFELKFGKFSNVFTTFLGFVTFIIFRRGYGFLK